MSDKKKFRETKFGQFLSKAGAAIQKHGGDVIEIAALAVSNPVAAISQVKDVLKKGAESDETARNLLLELERDRMEFKLELERIDLEKVKSFHGLESTQLQQEDKFTKRARPTRQYYWLVAVTMMIVLDYLNVKNGEKMVFLTFNNPLLYIIAADFGYYQLNRTKEKMNGVAT